MALESHEACRMSHEPLFIKLSAAQYENEKCFRIQMEFDNGFCFWSEKGWPTEAEARDAGLDFSSIFHEFHRFQ
jgi:hypothetical protein